MKVRYDFHIHTALSPCGEDAMSPNNIVNMALLNELDVIAITDHNSCENVTSIFNLSKDTGLIVIPGMEIETREEIHILSLFPSLDHVFNVQKEIYSTLPRIKNKKDIFGSQLLMDEEDEVIGEVAHMLAFASTLSIDEVYALVKSNHGVFIPAHIDRPSYSVISNLGMLPLNLPVNTIEISRFADFDTYQKKYPNHVILQSSDSHELGYIGICKRELEVKEKTIESILESIQGLSHL